MRRYIAISSVVVFAACYHGPSIYKFAPVQGPAGIDADLRLRSKTVVQGELLEVRDSSLIVLSDSGRVVSVPVGAIRQGRFGTLGDLIADGVNPESARPSCAISAGSRAV